MMNHRFNLFYAGYTAFLPSLYYNQLSLVQNYQTQEDEEIRNCLAKMCETVKQKEAEYNSYLQSAVGIAEEFELEVLPRPSSHTEYFNWLTHYADTFEKHFPMSRIDHYYFLYSRKLAEIYSHLGLIKFYIGLTLDLNNRLDLTHRIDKSLKDAEYIIFKMMAAAALLSSEPRHHYFNVFYKSMSNDYQTFKQVNVQDFDPEKFKALNADVDKYQCTIEDGYKKCIGLLKELQV
jgi:hypothetical protein